MHYFAYGSNLLESRLKSRVRFAKFLGIAELKGYELTFHFLAVRNTTFCNIMPNPSKSVWGAVFEIPRVMMGHLDKCEGAPVIYERNVVHVRLNGKYDRAIAYIGVDPIISNLRPFDWYKHHVVLGAHRVGLPGDYQDMLRAQPSRSDPDATRYYWESQFWQ